MIRYYVYNLESGKNFTVDDISFERISSYKRNVRIINDKHLDQLTFYAKEEESKPSKFFSGKLTTSVNDIMILLSLAQSRNIFYPRAKDTKTKDEWGMPLGGKRQPSGSIVITDYEIESYLKRTLNKIREPNYVNDTGLDLAIFWWLESVYANRPLETKFIAAFVSLEILANSYCSVYERLDILPKDKFKMIRDSLIVKIQQMDECVIPIEKKELITNKISSELNRLSIKEKILSLRDAYDWEFIDDSFVRDWVDIRNKYMHEGTVRSPQRFDKNLLSTRYCQLIRSVQIALLDLLGLHDFTRKQYLIDEIKKPIRQIIRVAGPFKVTT